ncbi:DUF6301 family protein [Dactylosporangium sp. CA-052675]|uniref:DUF6301 family protein n=1 Tax=Dactylosporangium sp. CA-052675 TaxID=3239927 RepID=UPI003D942150
MSTDLRMLSGDEVVALVRTLMTVRPLLRNAPAERIIQELGWTEIEHNDEVFFTDPGDGLGEGSVGLGDDGTPEVVTASIHTQMRGRDTDERRDFRQDAYSVAGRAITAEFGKPYALDGGHLPKLKWRIGDSAINLIRAPIGVKLWLWRPIDLKAREWIPDEEEYL